MCGIHGFINGGAKDKDISTFLSDGFVAGSVRGMDSSGIAIVDVKESEYFAQKLPVMGSMFITDKYAEQLLDKAASMDTIAICHTRAATSGKIGLNQAHPFYMTNEDESRVAVGVHNGTLTGWTAKEGAKDYSVDSEWALNHIFSKGMDAFKDINGAFVFAWWDSDDEDVLNFALNDQRTMYIGYTKSGGMAFASEPGMLYWLMERNRLYLDGQLLQLSSGHHYKFNIKDLKNPVRTKLPAFEAPVYSYHGTTSRSHYSQRATNMTAVGAVFAARASTAEAGASSTSTALVPQEGKGRSWVTVDEVQDAKALGVHSLKGKFVPFWPDEEEDLIFGSFYADPFDPSDSQDAVIRGASHLQFGVNTEWEVTALGIMDEGEKFTIICSKPRLTLAKEQAA